MNSVKQATTIDEQISRLRARGMTVDDDFARQWLGFVSYYRLSAYWYPAREFDPKGDRTDAFGAGVKFADVADLYEADRKLRSLVLDGLERVEIAMRTLVGEVLIAGDSLGYKDPARFRSNFEHEKWMKTVGKRVGRARKNNESIKHYEKNYGGEYPFWVLAETLDFSDISILFEGLQVSDQRSIAEAMGVIVDLDSLSANQQKKVKRQSPLVRWMEQLTIVRNTCAHHARLWNKSFAPAPTEALRTIPKFSALPEGQSEKMFGAMTVIANLVRVTSPGTTWPDKAAALIEQEFLKNPLVASTGLGIPDNWSRTF
ncbi:Abi family protein [Trueperella pecoris]|uniref:Abi family protein n=1 Tax=Trueperella pecoris TaxID=2733571 RepID=A0A7M1QWS7_9ACTO|nr:Abi family protein [Trueperella pecoris]QOR45964.1 Abi family protein [Trueperella pecoris]